MGYVASLKDCIFHVGERVGCDGDGGSHEGEITDVQPSGTQLKNGTTGEVIPGAILRIRCDTCPKPHLLSTPTVPQYQWSHLKEGEEQ